MLKLMGKKIIKILLNKIPLSGPIEIDYKINELELLLFGGILTGLVMSTHV